MRNRRVAQPLRGIINAFSAAAHRYRLPPGECAYCDRCRADPMMPSHDASRNCESGKRNHCTCDTCY